MGKTLVWDVTVDDVFAPRCFYQSSLGTYGTSDKDSQKVEKYQVLRDIQLVALKAGGSFGESSERTILCLCKMLCHSHEHQRAGRLLNQRFSMTAQIDHAAFVLGTVSEISF